MNRFLLPELIDDLQSGIACGERANSGVIQLRMNNVLTNGEMDFREYIRIPKTYLNEEMLLREGDVLFNNTNSVELVGKTALFPGFQEDVTFSNHFFRIRTKRNLLTPEYLAYWLQYLWSSDYFESICDRWVGQAAVQRRKLDLIEIPLPNVHIQNQIASELKSQLAEVETARQAAQLQVKEINRVLNEVIEFQIAKAVSSSNNPVKLGEVSIITAKIVHPGHEDYENLPHVSAENIESVTGRLMNIRSAKEDGMTSGKYLFDVGDILYSKLRPYLRKVAKPDFAGLCSADMYPIKADESVLNMAFLKLLLTSNLFTEYANEKSARSRMPKLNREQLFDFEFYLPTLDAQMQCVDRIDSVLGLSEQASTAAKVVLKDIDQLPKKILAQAFNQ